MFSKFKWEKYFPPKGRDSREDIDNIQARMRPLGCSRGEGRGQELGGGQVMTGRELDVKSCVCLNISTIN